MDRVRGLVWAALLALVSPIAWADRVVPLGSVHMGTLQSFIEARRRDGVRAKTINLGLGVVRHILGALQGQHRLPRFSNDSTPMGTARST
jgi:hypothetical protein